MFVFELIVYSHNEAYFDCRAAPCQGGPGVVYNVFILTQQPIASKYRQLFVPMEDIGVNKGGTVCRR